VEAVEHWLNWSSEDKGSLEYYVLSPDSFTYPTDDTIHAYPHSPVVKNRTCSTQKKKKNTLNLGVFIPVLPLAQHIFDKSKWNKITHKYFDILGQVLNRIHVPWIPCRKAMEFSYGKPLPLHFTKSFTSQTNHEQGRHITRAEIWDNRNIHKICAKLFNNVKSADKVMRYGNSSAQSS
jgi:hypothetical protein